MAGKLYLALLAATVAVPAAASVTVVIGSSDARMCYEAAEAPARPESNDMRHCNIALNERELTGYEEVATHVNRGILLLRTGNVDAAIADFDQALLLDPNQPEAYLNKGMALIQRDRPADARQLFTMALDRRTRRPEIAHYGRGIANEDLGDVRAAYQDYTRARDLAPEWRDPQVELTRFRVRGN